MNRRLYGAIVILAAAGAGCGNPSIDQRIELYGDELAGVSPGEHHRPGQPCVLCHSKGGGTSPYFSVGGTVFATPKGKMVPVGGGDPAHPRAVVTLTDSLGTSFTKPTNCIGNFFITEEEWNPSYPIAAEVRYLLPPYDKDAPQKVVRMGSRIGRDGSCASCHLDPLPTGNPNFPQPRSQISPGPVYVVDTQPSPPFDFDPACPGKFPAQ